MCGTGTQPLDRFGEHESDRQPADVQHATGLPEVAVLLLTWEFVTERQAGPNPGPGMLASASGSYWPRSQGSSIWTENINYKERCKTRGKGEHVHAHELWGGRKLPMHAGKQWNMPP